MNPLLPRVRRLLEDGPIPWEVDALPHVEWASVDAIRSFAIGTGDDNPLYTDVEVADTSVHGGLIAPPLFLLATGSSHPVPARDVPADLLEDLRTKVQIRDEAWELHSPLRPGERLERQDELTTLEPVEGCGDSTFDLLQVTIWWRGAEEVGRRTRRRRYGGAPRDRRARARARAVYTDEQIAAIEEANLAESRRGANTRSSQEVAVGHELPAVVRGPLTLTDLVSYRAAVGQGPFPSGVLRLRTLSRQTTPNLYSRDRSQAWDTIERLHWDDSFAEDRGHPAAYDYSHMRAVWFSQVLTDWAGDGAWLSRLTVERDEHNHVGDTQWIDGQITEVTPRSAGGGADITVRLRCRDQTGGRTFRGVAQLLLPDQEGGVATPTTAHASPRSASS